MSWERRRNGRLYFYRARRIGGKVVKEYVGAGLEAERVARRDAAIRGERVAKRHTDLELQRRVVEAGETLARLGKDCASLTAAVLAEIGIYQHHRGEWRRYGGSTNKKA